MERRRLRAGAVLLLAVVALGAAGAAVEQRGSGGSSGSGSGSGGGGSGESEDIGLESLEQTSDPLFSSEPLVMLIGAFAIVGIVVGIVYVALLVVELDLEELYAVARALAGRAAIGIALVLLVYVFLQFIAFPGGGGDGSDGALGGESGGVADTAADGGVGMPAVIGVAVLILVVLALLVLARSGGDEDEDGVAQVAPEPDEEAVGTAGSSPASTDVGRPPADNEVYRAWLSLADAADADPRRATPESVADGAVGTGIDEDAAREITSLFESVRYGRRDVDDGVERRARRARERLRGDS